MGQLRPLQTRRPMSVRRPILVASLATSLALTPLAALAHHGQDFLIVESPSVTHPGNVYLLANAAAALESDAEEQAGFEPALLVGVAPRVALELHAHTAKLAGDSWNYEATAPSVHVLLTDPERHDGLKAGLSAEYEIAREATPPTASNCACRWSRASMRTSGAATSSTAASRAARTNSASRSACVAPLARTLRSARRRRARSTMPKAANCSVACTGNPAKRLR